MNKLVYPYARIHNEGYTGLPALCLPRTYQTIIALGVMGLSSKLKPYYR